MSAPLTVALLGAGFWAQYQLSAWYEIPGVRCVGIVDPNHEAAQRLADRFAIPVVAASLEELLRSVRPDFVDIVASVNAHGELVQQACEAGLDVVCQKPLTYDLAEARGLVELAMNTKVQFFVHENWRWQRPLRQLRTILQSRPIGQIFRASIFYNNAFPVFQNQPELKQYERFILQDMGTHLFDVIRNLFGEAEEIFCRTMRTRSDIRGEDVATVCLAMSAGMTVNCQMSYASKFAEDCFPQTLVTIEGTSGSILLERDFLITVTTPQGVSRERYPPHPYSWSDPRYLLVHSSIVDCQRHLAECLRTQQSAETSAADNLRTLEIVDAAYRSSSSQLPVPIAR